MNKLLFASVISEIQQSDVFMTVKARICEGPAANLNGARVTEAFVNEIVGNVNRYVGLPLYADVKALTSGNYRRLGHLYDASTGEFHSTQIGSFYKFEKEKLDEGFALVGYARIPKRNKKLSNAICELFANSALKFSFEVSVGEYEELDDGTITIDASENNYLEGTAIVTYPACEEAVALELVAQKADDTEGGETEMADKKTLTVEMTAETVETPVETAEQVSDEVTASEVNAEAATETNVEVAAEADTEVNAEADTEAPAEAAVENTVETAETESTEEVAAVVVTREQHNVERTCAYDTVTQTEVRQTVEAHTEVTTVEDGEIVSATDEVREETAAEPVTEIAEDDPPAANPEPETPAEVPVTDAADHGTKKTAEELIAELAEQIRQMKDEIAEMKEHQTHIAESTPVIAEINPLMDDISTPKKYSLLEKDEPVAKSYTLLSK